MAAPDVTNRARFDELSDLVRTRRTSMIVDQHREVPIEMVTELCQLATWAPNHKKTWPWRFALFTGEGRAVLGDTMANDMTRADFGDEMKRTKTRTKYLRTPAALVVGCTAHDNDMLHAENRDAVAAGIQNLLLGATALGLASFWSTPAMTHPAAVLELCAFEPADRLIGVIYLGWEAQTCEPPMRPEVLVAHVAER
jgi:nitroreductase